LNAFVDLEPLQRPEHGCNRKHIPLLDKLTYECCYRMLLHRIVNDVGHSVNHNNNQQTIATCHLVSQWNVVETASTVSIILSTDQPVQTGKVY